MAQLSWSRISPDRIREKSFTKIFRSYIFTCKQKSVQDMLYCEHNHSPFKCFLFMLRERGGCDFNFGETRFHFLMSLMKKIFAILISWKHSRNNPGCLTKRSYLRKGQECCGNRTGVCFFRYRKDGKEKNLCFRVRSEEGQGEFRGCFLSLLRTMQEGCRVGSSERLLWDAASQHKENVY